MVTDPKLLNREKPDRLRVLWLSTIAFTLMFAVWLMFGVLGVPIRKEFGLTDVQLSWISAVAILNGSLWRLIARILTDRYGGKLVFTLMLLFTAIPAYLVSRAGSYEELLLYAFLVGFAGNSFSVGIAWNSAWFPKDQQGFALGLFGAGNVGASVTKFIGPALIASVPAAGYLGGLIPGGWRFIPFLYAVLLVLMGLVMWFSAPQDKRPGQGRPLLDMLKPLRYVQGLALQPLLRGGLRGYVALSAWLPKYYVDVFSLPLHEAALLTALFIFPASLLRPLGGYLSDRIGARRLMYWTFGIILLASGVLMMPEGHIVLYTKAGPKEVMQFTMNVWLFTLLVFLIGVGMGVGKAAVYNHIPTYFPNDVGAVGGLVGMLGALGGFFLPPLFAYAQAWTGLPQMTFFVLFVLTAIAFVWMHLTVLQLLQQEARHLRNEFELKGDRPCP
jgi:Nitrate/nitrite transporter